MPVTAQQAPHVLLASHHVTQGSGQSHAQSTLVCYSATPAQPLCPHRHGSWVQPTQTATGPAHHSSTLGQTDVCHALPKIALQDTPYPLAPHTLMPPVTSHAPTQPCPGRMLTSCQAALGLVMRVILRLTPLTLGGSIIIVYELTRCSRISFISSS